MEKPAFGKSADGIDFWIKMNSRPIKKNNSSFVNYNISHLFRKTLRGSIPTNKR